MFLFKKENVIILSLIMFMAFSFLYLAYTEQKQRDLNSYNIWELYFEDPKSDNLNFVIENHSDKTNFHWAVSSDTEKFEEGDAKMAKGQSAKINLSDIESAGKKITITISDGKDKKEIYKIFYPVK